MSLMARIAHCKNSSFFHSSFFIYICTSGSRLRHSRSDIPNIIWLFARLIVPLSPMRYFVIAGEPSGDLHAGLLMDAIRREDDRAEIRYWYRPELAYMGFVSVLVHLREILQGMRECRKAISDFRPDRLVLVDYPGFNLGMAAWFRSNVVPRMKAEDASADPKVVYYIPPKVWAWKERRVAQIKRNVDRVLSILPFEVNWYAQRHSHHVDYVGNPTLDEIATFRKSLTRDEVEQWRESLKLGSAPVLALMPGSRRLEIERNLPPMLRAAREVGGDVQYVIAQAPNMPREFYDEVMSRVPGLDADDAFRRRVLLAPYQGSRSSFLLLHSARAALVTSGTATLETAIMGVPQVVCYATQCGWFVSQLKRLLLKVPYVSLVNLIADAEVVPELVAGDLTPARLRQELGNVLFDEAYRACQQEGYKRVMLLLGEPGAPERAARLVVESD